jgi:N4-gp56 family major capsid protein
MALGSSHVTNTTAATFIPEIWSDEIIASYEKSLVVRPLVRAMSMVGKKGDTVHIPKPDRGTANAKAAEAQVTLNAGATGELVVTIDQHFEYSRLIEDITDVQALSSLRKFYTEDAGYALAINVDSALVAEANAGFTAKKSFVAGGLADESGATTTAFNDLGFRTAIQILDDNNVPGDNRVIVIPPAVKRDLLGISNYISADFVSGKPVENGKVGSLYGVDIYISTNLTGNAGEANCLLMHKDALVIAEQLGVRTQTQYKQEYLADLLTADTLYGVETYRPENGVTIAALV